MPQNTEKKWIEIGRSTTTPIDEEARTEVKIDIYYLVVGFEVNNKNAYIDGVQNLSLDYGHAFFYLVKNNIITLTFSFGPDRDGEIGLLKDGQINSRKGTADYGITEIVRAFKIKINSSQAKKLEITTKKTRDNIASGKMKYIAYLNDTCAETARDILEEAGIKTPGGAGPIKYKSNYVAYAVNPYRWHDNFKKEIGGEVIYDKHTRAVPGGVWRPYIDHDDPIFGMNDA